ncbi:glycosyltransferase family 2 protein [Franconibacter helveticus]|uniref:glycosyltransferase family 2 protein n=1 Tax=Franconibacter helveticus TaxID=357240 RepID=UPI000DA229F3|nr:glycosyltransferase family 2 protein [Franconibacter helveticus]
MINIIVVSHDNIADVKTILEELAEKNELYTLWVRDNVNDSVLKDLCAQYENVNYFAGIRREGFAQNNNIMVEHIISTTTISDDDYLLFMNPDAFITKERMLSLCSLLAIKKLDMFTVDLYADAAYSVRDPSIRKFPSLKTFLSSFLFNSNSSIVNRDLIQEQDDLDWCASSFFGIKLNHFKTLNGFDSRYFMYCEDVDLCYRAKRKGIKLSYIPEIKAIHYAQQNSKRLFTRNFCWHVKSAMLFLWVKYKLSR